MKKLSIESYKPLLVGLASLVLVTGTYFLGYLVGHQNLKFAQGYKPLLVSKELGKPKDIDFSLFWSAWAKVTTDFAGKIDNQKMIYGAINGAIASLGDPFSYFLPPEDAKRFNEDLQGNFEGVGAEIQQVSGLITVVAPLDGSPAEKAGLRAQDIILTIDGTETTGMSVDEAVNKIRGAKGTVVKLTVLRSGAKAPIEVAITRDTIVIKSVTWKIRDGNLGYIKINEFGDDTLNLVNQAVDEMVTKKPRALVLDLRNNPGGYLTTAVDTSSLFLKDRGVVVREEDRDGHMSEEKTTLAAKLPDIPMVVLVNGGSASASEIVAGALQDYGRAKLIGDKTFGKGSVQEVDPVGKAGAAIRITVAKWLTPKGRQINKLGITPDISVALSDDDVKDDKDPQYDRAVVELQ